MRLTRVKRLDELLMEVSVFVEQLTYDDRLAIAQINDWLQAVENELVAARSPRSASFATLRAQLGSVDRGLCLPGLELSRPRSPRAWRQIGATSVLGEATELLNTLLTPDRARLEEADSALRQALELARLRETLGGKPMPWQSASALWDALLRDEDLTVLATRAVSLLGESEARQLLDAMLAGGPAAIGELSDGMS